MFNYKRKDENPAKIVFRADNPQTTSSSSEPVFPKQKGISKSLIALLSVIFLGAVAAYFLYSGDEDGKALSSTEVIKPKDNSSLPRQEESTSSRDSLLSKIKSSETVQNDAQNANSNPSAYINPAGSAQDQVKDQVPDIASPLEKPAEYGNSNHAKKEAKERAIIKTQYKVPSKAYFYSQPNHRSRKANFINNWKKSYPPLNALDEKNGFIYVVFTDENRQTSEGWLRKKDVKPVKSIMNGSDLK